MKKFTIIISIIATLFLTGCFERENPLKSLSSDDVARWLYNNKNIKMVSCAKLWENQGEATEIELKNCENMQKSIARRLTDAGFGEILPEDVTLPTIWQKFNEQIARDKRNSVGKKPTIKHGDKAVNDNIQRLLKESRERRKERQQ